MKRLMFITMLLVLSISCYAQEPGEYTLFVGEFENRTDIANPLLSYLNDTLNFLLSRSKLADIHPISPGLRSAYLQRARNEQPNVIPTQLALLAAGYAKADAVLVGSYSKTGAQWSMDAQLYVTREGSRAKEDIHLAGDDLYRLLDGLAAEVSRRLGTGRYMLLSTPSWEAYEAYRLGHQAYYNFDMMGAIRHFQQAIELDPHLAIAHAELGLSYVMIGKHEKARTTFAEAMRNLRYASKPEQLATMGLESFYRYFWVLKRKTSGLAGADIPRMREDTVWHEPWLHWYIGETSQDTATRDREYKQWLLSTIAYARAGFYGVAELVNLGTRECIKAFDASEDPQFLDAALQFIAQAADLEADDEYDDAWKHWELSNIYRTMSKPADVQKHREQWLQAVKRKPMSSLSPDTLNDFAQKCLTMGAAKDALEFAEKAVKLESDPDLRSQYLVTLADAQLASGKLTEAFNEYIEAFNVFAHGDASTKVLSDSLSGLTQLVRTHSGFVDEAKRAKLNEVMKAIENMDPHSFRGYTAKGTIGGVTLKSTRDFCVAMGDIGPILTLVRGMLKAETEPAEQLYFLSYLASFNALTESERKAIEAYKGAPKSESTVVLYQEEKPKLYSMGNVLAAGNYNQGTDSSDITLIIQVEMDGKIVIDEGAPVKYMVPQEDIQGWTEVEFNDSNWEDGISGVGYGKGDDNTTVQRGNVASIYTRYHFDVPNASSVKQITIRVDYDDAFILWLNGIEIGRTANIASLSPVGEVPKWNVSVWRNAMSGHTASELPAGKPNKGRWWQNIVTQTIDVEFGGQTPFPME